IHSRSMTWCRENSTFPGFVLASSAIHCRFVDRFARFIVPSRVSRQGFSLTAPPFPLSGPGEPSSPLSSVLCRRYDFPLAYPRSLIGSLPQPTRFLLSFVSRLGAPGGQAVAARSRTVVVAVDPG